MTDLRKSLLKAGAEEKSIIPQESLKGIPESIALIFAKAAAKKSQMDKATSLEEEEEEEEEIEEEEIEEELQISKSKDLPGQLSDEERDEDFTIKEVASDTPSDRRATRSSAKSIDQNKDGDTDDPAKTKKKTNAGRKRKGTPREKVEKMEGKKVFFIFLSN
jgi:hypothetical protein